MHKRKDLLNVAPTISWQGKLNRKYFLLHLIVENNYKTMAEIGVRDGRTTFYLLDNCPDLIIYAVDLSNAGYYNESIKQKYKDRLVPIEGNSHAVAHRVPTVDIVFIDADHSYAGCSGDIAAYRPKVNKGGILSGHDIDYPGVNKAVCEKLGKFDVGPNNVWFVRV